jgi:hypothetical protein
MSAERGVIQNKARAKQLFSFKDLQRMRNITPTDIDGLIDYNGRAFVYLEGKYGRDKKLEQGQRMALEHVVDSHWKSGHPSMVLNFWHETPLDPEVPVGWMFVKGIYSRQPIICLTSIRWQDTFWWTPQSQTIKVKDALGFFEEQFKTYGL